MEKNKVRVSVILPVYNEEQYLRQCLDNITGQTLREIEIICVDDGSTDGSLSILREYESKDSCIKVISVENRGAGAARNTGMAEAAGEYLYFPDSDDYCELTLLEEACREAECRNADVTIFKSDRLDQISGEIKPCTFSLYLDKLPEHRPFAISEVNGNFFRFIMGWAWDKLFRRSFVEEEKLFFQEQRTTNDMYFTYMSLLKAKRITTVDKALYTQRINVANSLSMTRDKSWDCFYTALCSMKKEIKEMRLWDKIGPDYTDYALHICLDNLYSTRPNNVELYNVLRGKWFDDLGINSSPQNWFTSQVEYEEYQLVRNSWGYKEYEQYVLRREKINSKE